MTEPEYRYIKGQGWIPTSTRAEDFFWGHFKVTIEDRAPSPDEYYLSSNFEYGEFTFWLKRQYNWLYIRYDGDNELDEVVLVNKKHVYTTPMVRL